MKELILESKIAVYDTGELTPEDRELVECAKQATGTSYSPYSRFRVGAALRLADGTVVSGSNQENAAFPSGMCAERTALFYANARYPVQPVTALAIAARTDNGFLPSPVPPCGACRQVIAGVEERYGTPVKILLYGTEGTYVADSIKVLLPLQFIGDTMRI